MTPTELIDKADALLSASKTAVLCTEGKGGFPRLRWMTPVLLPQSPGNLYALSVGGAEKISDIRAHPRVTWMIQSKTLVEIVAFEAIARLVQSPSLTATIQEALGNRLGTFWKIHAADAEVIVIESVVVRGSYFNPVKGLRESVTFREEEELS